VTTGSCLRPVPPLSGLHSTRDRRLGVWRSLIFSVGPLSEGY
jgi:hypothetical protein